MRGGKHARKSAFRKWIDRALGSLGEAVRTTPHPYLVLAVLLMLALRPLVDLAVEAKLGPFTLGQLWGGGFIMLTATYVLARRQVISALRRLWPAFALPGLFVALTIWRPDRALAVTEALKLLQVSMAVAFALALSTGESKTSRVGGDARSGKESQKLLTWALCLFAALLIVTAGFRIATGQFGGAYYVGAATGQPAQQAAVTYDTTAQGPHGTALLAVMLVPFLLGIRGKRRNQLVALTAVALLSGVVVLSYVRSALFALVAVLAWWVLSRDVGSPLLTRRAKIVASAVLVLAAAIIAGPEIVKRFSDIGLLFSGGPQSQYAGGSRVGIWGAVWSSIIARPLTFLYGQGAGASVLAVHARYGVDLWAHNDFLEFLITGGLPLLGAYVFAIAKSFGVLIRAQAWGARNPGTPMSEVYQYGVGALCGFLLMSFLNAAVFFTATVLLALLIGCALGDMERTSAGPGVVA